MSGWKESTQADDSLDRFLETYWQLSKAIAGEIEKCNWDEVNRLLEQREDFIQREGQQFATGPTLPLNDKQRDLLRRIQALEQDNQGKLEEQMSHLTKQMQQTRRTRQAVRGYMEEGIDRTGLVSTLFNQEV